MIKAPHEALHRIFQNDATLFARAVQNALGISFPEPRTVSIVDTDLTEIMPIERRADTVLAIDTDEGEHLVIIESQTAPDESRRRAWPYYIAYLHNKHRSPVTLLVLTADEKTARWARETIAIGLSRRPSLMARPLVLGPDNVPAITGIDMARQDVMLAVLSALTHRHSQNVGEILETLAVVLDEVDLEIASQLAEFTAVGLGKTPALDIWRTIMTTMDHEYRSPFERQLKWVFREEARIEARREAVFQVLRARGLSVPEEVERRISQCYEDAPLEALLVRAVTVRRAEDLFDEV